MTESTPEGAELKGFFGALRRLYAWVLSWAYSPYGVAALVLLSFVESSFFPIPPDPLLMALVLGRPRRWAFLALACTVASVLGGLFGYGLGLTAFDVVGRPIIAAYGKEESFEQVQGLFSDYGSWAVFVAAFTPIPYKVFTLTAGFAQMDIPSFVIASFLGRGGRFFLAAGLVGWKGEAIAGFIQHHFEKLTVAFAVLFVLGFVALRFLF